MKRPDFSSLTPMFRSFLMSMFIFGIATGLFSGVMNNYLAEILKVDRFGRGVVEFVREIPGLILFLLLALLRHFSETRIIRLAFAVALAGLTGLIFAGGNLILGVGLIVCWSAAEHLVMPARSSIAVHAAERGKEGMALGLTGSAGNIGMVTGYYMVPLLFIFSRKMFGAGSELKNFQTVFAAAAFFVFLGLLFTSRIHDKGETVKRAPIVIRRKYLRYYFLEMFYGGRKQVFLTFAPFVLILNYGAGTETIALLFGIYSLLSIFLSPLIGKLIDKIGYKKILVADAVFLVLLCMLYGFSHLLFTEATAYLVIKIVFVLDGLLFVAAMARTVYVRSLSDDKHEVTSTLSSGISVNHLFSVIIALLGGLLWQKLGIELLFSLAAVMGLGEFLFALFLPAPDLRRVKPPLQEVSPH